MKVKWLGRNSEQVLDCKCLSKKYTAKAGIFDDMLKKDFKALLADGDNASSLEVLDMTDEDKAKLAKSAKAEKKQAEADKAEMINSLQKACNISAETVKDLKAKAIDAKDKDAETAFLAEVDKAVVVAKEAKEALQAAKK